MQNPLDTIQESAANPLGSSNTRVGPLPTNIGSINVLGENFDVDLNDSKEKESNTPLPKSPPKHTIQLVAPVIPSLADSDLYLHRATSRHVPGEAFSPRYRKRKPVAKPLLPSQIIDKHINSRKRRPLPIITYDTTDDESDVIVPSSTVPAFDPTSLPKPERGKPGKKANFKKLKPAKSPLAKSPKVVIQQPVQQEITLLPSTASTQLDNFEGRKLEVKFKLYEIKVVDYVGFCRPSNVEEKASSTYGVYHETDETVLVKLPSTIVEEIASRWVGKLNTPSNYSAIQAWLRFISRRITFADPIDEHTMLLYGAYVGYAWHLRERQSMDARLSGRYVSAWAKRAVKFVTFSTIASIVPAICVATSTVATVTTPGPFTGLAAAASVVTAGCAAAATIAYRSYMGRFGRDHVVRPHIVRSGHPPLASVNSLAPSPELKSNATYSITGPPSGTNGRAKDPTAVNPEVARVTGFAVDGREPVVFATNQHNTIKALEKRTLIKPASFEPEARADAIGWVMSRLDDIICPQFRIEMPSFPSDEYDAMMEEWIGNTTCSGPAKAAYRKCAKELKEAGISCHSDFSKKELYNATVRGFIVKLETNICDDDKFPRQILPGEAIFQLLTAPFIKKFTGVLRKNWNGKRKPILYAPGTSARTVAERITSQHWEHQENSDFNGYDSNQDIQHGTAEVSICKRYGAPRGTIQLLTANLDTHGRTRDGLTFNAPYCKNSGDPGTTCFNSFWNGALHLRNTCVSQGIPISSVRALFVVGGDDASNHYNGPKVDHPSMFTNIGMPVTVETVTKQHDIEFLSCLLRTTSYGPSFIPLVGKMIAKLGYSVRARSPREAKEIAKSTAMSFQACSSGCPILSKVVSTVLRLTSTSNHSSQPRDWAMNMVHTGYPVDQTWAELEDRYGYTTDMHALLCTELDSLAEAGCVIDSPILKHIIDVDSGRSSRELASLLFGNPKPDAHRMNLDPLPVPQPEPVEIVPLPPLVVTCPELDYHKEVPYHNIAMISSLSIMVSEDLNLPLGNFYLTCNIKPLNNSLTFSSQHIVPGSTVLVNLSIPGGMPSRSDRKDSNIRRERRLDNKGGKPKSGERKHKKKDTRHEKRNETSSVNQVQTSMDINPGKTVAPRAVSSSIRTGMATMRGSILNTGRLGMVEPSEVAHTDKGSSTFSVKDISSKTLSAATTEEARDVLAEDNAAARYGIATTEPSAAAPEPLGDTPLPTTLVSLAARAIIPATLYNVNPLSDLIIFLLPTINTTDASGGVVNILVMSVPAGTNAAAASAGIQYSDIPPMFGLPSVSTNSLIGATRTLGSSISAYCTGALTTNPPFVAGNSFAYDYPGGLTIVKQLLASGVQYFAQSPGAIPITSNAIEVSTRPIDSSALMFDDYWINYANAAPDIAPAKNTNTLPYIVIQGLPASWEILVTAISNQEGTTGLAGLDSIPDSTISNGTICDTATVFDKMIEGLGSVAMSGVRDLLEDPVDSIGKIAGSLLKFGLGASKLTSLRNRMITKSARKTITLRSTVSPTPVHMLDSEGKIVSTKHCHVKDIVSHAAKVKRQQSSVSVPQTVNTNNADLTTLLSIILADRNHPQQQRAPSAVGPSPTVQVSQPNTPLGTSHYADPTYVSSFLSRLTGQRVPNPSQSFASNDSSYEVVNHAQ